MNKINKTLLILIILLIPITVISFLQKETNFSNEENIKKEDKIEKEYLVQVKKNDEILSLDMNTYLIGVIAGEMPASFEEEALKAQAIASRTYLLNHQEKNNIIDSTTASQVYLSNEEMQNKWNEKFDLYYKKIEEAVIKTENLILTYAGKPIKAYYYAMSNGYSESSLNVFNEETEYLNVVESTWDKDNEKTIIITKKDFCNKLNINCDSIKISNITKDKSNRVSTININNNTYTGIEIRQKLNLRSTDFEITPEENDIKITTHGYGHGVGMSQYGANYMAQEGYSYEEILKHYYENTEISKI